MGKHIYLIDDDYDDAEIFSYALRDIYPSATLTHYDNGLTAVEMLKNEELVLPDVIFLDINMPFINGWECLRQIKGFAENKKIPIVMYSTSDIEKEGLVAQDLGARAFLIKPSTLGELKNKLSRLFNEFWQ